MGKQMADGRMVSGTLNYMASGLLWFSSKIPATRNQENAQYFLFTKLFIHTGHAEKSSQDVFICRGLLSKSQSFLQRKWQTQVVVTNKIKYLNWVFLQKALNERILGFISF